MQQNAFEDDDSYTSLAKQDALISLIFSFEEKARRAVEAGADIEKIAALSVRERIGRAKSVPEAEYARVFAEIDRQISDQLDALIAKA